MLKILIFLYTKLINFMHIQGLPNLNPFFLLKICIIFYILKFLIYYKKL